ncbi:hypothetical protein ACQKOM_08315 [Peribacillus frigoritolerans]
MFKIEEIKLEVISIQRDQLSMMTASSLEAGSSHGTKQGPLSYDVL